MNPQNQKLYVGNLNFDATVDQVRELFAAHGEVAEVKIIMDRFSGRSRGFAFVRMATSEGAGKAKDALHGQPFQGKALVIDWARTEQRDRPAMGGERRERPVVPRTAPDREHHEQGERAGVGDDQIEKSGPPRLRAVVFGDDQQIRRDGHDLPRAEEGHDRACHHDERERDDDRDEENRGRVDFSVRLGFHIERFEKRAVQRAQPRNRDLQFAVKAHDKKVQRERRDNRQADPIVQADPDE